MRRQVRRLAEMVLMLLLGIPGACQARVVRIQIQEQSPVLDGATFGNAGAYERVVGRAYFAVDPQNPANKQIVDLSLAPKNKDNGVEFSADIYILRPIDPKKSNGAVLCEISNRGNKSLLSIFDRAKTSLDPRSAEEFGDGYLLREGYTLLWVGWQYDVEPGKDKLRLDVPVIEGLDGIIRAEVAVNSKVFSAPLATPGHRPYPVANPDGANLKLMVRDQVEGPRTEVPRSEWHIENGTNIVLNGGFEPGRLYDLVYTAENPGVAGLGFAAIRDTVSWLKYGGSVEGAPTAPAKLPRAYAFGASQSGRFLRALLYYGFNRDESDRMSFDGVMAHIAGGGRGSFNERFATPWMPANPVSGTLNTVDIFPFTDLEEIDPTSGMHDGILTHALPKKFWPKIFYTNSATEYYSRAAGLIHVTIDAKKDAEIPANTRIYFFAGGQHGPAAFPPPEPHGTRNVTNFNPYPWSLRALLADIDAWVKNAAPPPPSQYPHIADGQLVTEANVKFPKIPGIDFPTTLHLAYPSDFGPEYRSKGILTVLPPTIGTPYPMPVPQVDGDGNELAGIHSPELQVPLATYTGWNLRTPEIGAPQLLYDIAGSFIPFSLTKEVRTRSGDPRPSIEERYRSREEYLAKYELAARSLVQARFLLPSDVPAIVKQGGAEWDYVHSLKSQKVETNTGGAAQ